MADGPAVPSGPASSAAVAASATSSSNKDASYFPAPFAHLALLITLVLPYFIEVQSNISCLLHACLAVYVGCWRSVKPAAPTEAMTTKEAMRFPIMGSLVLFSLFLVFKFLPKDLVNMVLTGYFGVLGTIALTAVLLPFVEPLLPERIASVGYFKAIKLPFIADPVEFEATLPELLLGLPAAGLCLWYCFTRHWLANNVLGLAFSIEGIEHLALGSVMNGVILLCGLFVYDVFWVFCTPVMVAVAKSFDAPIKLLFPRGLTEEGKTAFAMLGLGDIVIPGIFVALMLRYDMQCGVPKGTRYFAAVFGGYFAGLAATIVVMNVFKAAQPALLYIVPALLATAFGLAAVRREVKAVYGWTETEEDSATKGEEKKDQ